MRVLIQSLAFIAWIFAASTAASQDTALARDLVQQDDRGFIVGLLEDALGGEGRTVRVDGFAGALSRTATIERATIADEAGVWLTLENLQLEWNRTALLRGRIDIERLSAALLTLDRLPVAPESDMPAAEASGFSLPNLPVSVAISQFKIDRIVIAEPVLGAPAEMVVEASATLAEGSGEVSLKASRIDDAQGDFTIEARYAADTQIAAIDLDLIEAPDGIVARALNLPGRPDLRLTVAGEGNIDDLVTQITLETDGDPRLDGQVTLRGSSVSGRVFDLDLSGDLTPILPPEYHGFFGNRTSLRARGAQDPIGRLALSDLNLQTGAVVLQGAVELDQTYWPTRMSLSGEIASETAGVPVVLPFDNASTQIARAGLQVAYDASVSDALEVQFDVADLTTTGVSIKRAELMARGALQNVLAAQNTVQAAIEFRAEDAQFDDAGLQKAIGSQVAGAMQVGFEVGGPLRLDAVQIVGADYRLSGMAVLAELSGPFETAVDVSLEADRLAQFATLIGNDIAGQAEVDIKGVLDLGGRFDLAMTGKTRDLSVGIVQADRALAGATDLDMAVIRDMDGTRITRLEIDNEQLVARGNANLKTDASTADFDLRFADSAEIDPNLQGPVALRGTAIQDAEGWIVDTSMRGPFDATATVNGRVTGLAPALEFRVALPDIQPFAGQFRGPATLAGTASSRGDVWSVATTLQGPYGVAGTLSGTVTGAAPKLLYNVSLPDVGALGAGINGSLSLDGTAAQQGAAWRVDTALSGLSGMRAQVNGFVQNNGTLNLETTGVAPLALANPFLAPRNLQGQAAFDLALRGPASLTSLSGSITTSNAQLSAPTLRLALSDIVSRVNLDRGRAQVDLTAAVSSGGRIAVRGPVTLTGSFPADLAVSLRSVRLADPALYQTSVNGQLTVRGALAGGALISGQINVGETNILVPESQATGFAIIPQIIHQNPSARVRQTLRRAGLDEVSKNATASKGGASYGLDIRVDAPSRIFVRGRGLDAELGGALNLLGTTNQMISAGRFNLIRGRLDLLGKRFVLDEGTVALQGGLDPFLRFVATTTTTQGTASILIEGRASQPEVTFSSSPEAPQDEVLAQIFFGRDASTLSAFQALQLASAVTTLAGKGGEGIVSKLRRGFGLDDLDVTTDTDGNTGLRLGKYLSDNIYTDVTIGSANTAGVSINIDLSPSVTARGQVKSNGDSSVGIYFEKDY